MSAIIECVPNFSEGHDISVIEAIASSISSCGCKVLHTDMGYDTHRTVITFAGEASNVCTGAFEAVKRAASLIDMRIHTGAHPRQGATDVLPLVPVSGITMAECASLARKLAERIYTELGIPCYCYGQAAFTPERRRLEVCREGEYEALAAKIADPARKPDFCGDSFTLQAARSGATTVGARDFLIAVNFNLDTDDVAAAKSIALDVRARGRMQKDSDGKPVLDGSGKPVFTPGLLPGCKAIGWYIPEYGFAQVSMNITDISLTPLHKAFETVSTQAARRGLHVTGTEIIGLVPKRVLIDAGKYFSDNADSQAAIQVINNVRHQALAERAWGGLQNSQRGAAGFGAAPQYYKDREHGLHAKALPGVHNVFYAKAQPNERELMDLAVEKMGLSTLKPYNIEERVIEYLI